MAFLNLCLQPRLSITLHVNFTFLYIYLHMDIYKANKLRAQHKSYRAIAKELGCSHQTIAKHFQKNRQPVRFQEMQESSVNPLTQPHLLPPALGRDVVPNYLMHAATFRAGKNYYLPPDLAIQQSRENAQAMYNNLLIREPLQARQWAVAEQDWHIEPYDKKDARQIEIADKLQHIIECIPDFLKMRYSLLKSRWFGVYAVQINYQWNAAKELHVKRWSEIHGDSLLFKMDSDEVGVYVSPGSGIKNEQHITTEAGYIGRVHKFEEDKIEFDENGLPYQNLTFNERQAMVLMSYDPQASDFMDARSAGGIKGLGLRSTCYPVWLQMTEITGWMIDWLERFGTGVTIYRFVRGNEESYEQAKTLAQSQDVNASVMMPVDMSSGTPVEGIERQEPSAVGLDNVLKVIQDFFAPQLRRFIVGQDATSQPMNAGLGSEIADVQENTFARILHFDCVDLQECLTRQLVQTIQQWSFPGTKPCRFVIDFAKPNVAEQMQNCKMAYDMGVTLVEDEVRSLCGLTKPTAEDVTISNKQQQKPQGAPKPFAKDSQLEDLLRKNLVKEMSPQRFDDDEGMSEFANEEHDPKTGQFTSGHGGHSDQPDTIVEAPGTIEPQPDLGIKKKGLDLKIANIEHRVGEEFTALVGQSQDWATNHPQEVAKRSKIEEYDKTQDALERQKRWNRAKDARHKPINESGNEWEEFIENSQARRAALLPELETEPNEKEKFKEEEEEISDEEKGNPNHDNKTGQFTSGGGGGKKKDKDKDKGKAVGQPPTKKQEGNLFTALAEALKAIASDPSEIDSLIEREKAKPKEEKAKPKEEKAKRVTPKSDITSHGRIGPENAQLTGRDTPDTIELEEARRSATSRDPKRRKLTDPEYYSQWLKQIEKETTKRGRPLTDTELKRVFDEFYDNKPPPNLGKYPPRKLPWIAADWNGNPRTTKLFPTKKHIDSAVDIAWKHINKEGPEGLPKETPGQAPPKRVEKHLDPDQGDWSGLDATKQLAEIEREIEREKHLEELLGATKFDPDTGEIIPDYGPLARERPDVLPALKEHHEQEAVELQEKIDDVLRKMFPAKRPAPDEIKPRAKTEEHKVPDAIKKKATLPDWSNMNKIQRAEYLANKVKRAEEELDNRTLSEHWKNEPEKYPHRQYNT